MATEAGRFARTILTLMLATSTPLGCQPLPEVPVRAPAGLLVAIQRGPLTTSFEATPTTGRIGTAKTFFLREPFLRTTWAFGDASIAAAMREGDLARIHFADYEMVSILGAAGIFEVRVYGEPSATGGRSINQERP